ncbi:hypothetical protein CARUB_v10022046mg [Capsella rubella]|uniref:DUF1985 domain-containing protein n=1 Tax=Capsella rubella TaxID=81985 RepID=R0GFU0_9BRAS|nr:hypothetical protein CARUB_v10022046mg [Capsella rubella]
MLPLRLFATNRYPTGGRINSYSRPEYLLDIWLKKSSFGGLLKLPIWRSSQSGKLVHQVLCRSLVTDKRHKMWFVYGGQPIRFSMREFAILTWLNCNPYPPEEEIKEMQTPRRKDETYWKKLFGPHSSMSIRDIVEWLKRDKRLPKSKRMDGQKRLRLALLVIVEGILVCDSSNVRATRKAAQMLADINSFDSFPWGRLSFERKMLLATHGFTLAIQLLILQAVPLLQNYLLGPDDSQTFAFRSVSQLTMCKRFHNSTILETEMDEKLQVESILKMEDTLELGTITWGDEVEDERIDFLCDVIKDGHIFKAESWHGGFSNLPSIYSGNEKDVDKVQADDALEVDLTHPKVWFWMMLSSKLIYLSIGLPSFPLSKGYQVLTPLPPKRRRRGPRRYGHSSQKRKEVEVEVEADMYEDGLYTPFRDVNPQLWEKFLAKLASHGEK